MKIIASSLGKKFGNRWIFRNINLELEQGKSYAIRGENGVGKSSLMLALCNFMLLSEGTLTWEKNKTIIAENHYKDYFSLVSPSLEIPLEWSVTEFLRLCLQIENSSCTSLEIEKRISDAYLEPYQALRAYQLSSGTLRRLMLVTCFYSLKPVLMLDEFSSHLDEKGKAWAFAHIKRLSNEKMILISTNDEREASLCNEQIILS